MSAFFKLLLIFSFASYFGRSFAILKNVTYDNTDPSVTYLPSGGLGWSLDLQEGLDYGGTHALADDIPNASATFKFTGVAVYYFSPLWPYNVSTVLSLDGGENFTVSLFDQTATESSGGPPTQASAARYGFTGLSNDSHTLSMFSIQIPNLNEASSDPSQTEWIVVDGFNVTIDDGSPAAQPTSTGGSKKTDIGAIVGGAVGGIVVIAAIISFIFVYRRRTRRQGGVRPWGEGGVLSEHPASNVPFGATPYSDASPRPPPMEQNHSHQIQSVYSVSESGYRTSSFGNATATTWAGASEAGGSSSQPGSASSAVKQPEYFNEKRLQRLTVANEEPVPPPAYTEEHLSSSDPAETEVGNAE